MYLLWIVFVQNQCYSEGQGGFGVPNIFFPTLFPAPLWPGQLFCRSFSQLGVLNCSPPSETQRSFRPEVRITEHTLGTFSPHSFWSAHLDFWADPQLMVWWAQADVVAAGVGISERDTQRQHDCHAARFEEDGVVCCHGQHVRRATARASAPVNLIW